MTKHKLAAQLARDIFEAGDEPGSPCNRIQFLGGSWANQTEKPQGGFCKDALATFILYRLSEYGVKDEQA